MTPDQTKAVVKAYFDEYVTLHTRRGLSPAQAAERVGISRPRYYQIKQGKSTMSLTNFLNMLAEINKMKIGKEEVADTSSHV